MTTKNIPAPHEVRLVWDRDRELFNFWCMTCNRSGGPFLNMNAAILDGQHHADMWARQLPPSPWMQP